MSTMENASVLEGVSTSVPTIGQRELRVEAGDPWPSAYRGSRYSVVSSQNFGDVARWTHKKEIQAMTELPEGLQSALRSLGKTDGYGSFRITASGEVLTKVPADYYAKTNLAEASRGYIPVYVGKLSGCFDFTEISNDPPRISNGELSVWTGLPFNHGETWAVCTDDKLRWSWKDYYFESAFDHPELVAAYKSIRPPGGRIYINEHGHVWGNVDREVVPERELNRVQEAVSTWNEKASNAERRLVNRRLKHTESEDVPDGLLPMYFGHLSQFDGGIVPKPVVSDNSYFGASAVKQQK